MKSFHLRWASHLPNMGSVFASLYQTEGLSDVCLGCSDGSLRAHKLILSTCSDYFLDLFLESQSKRTVVVLPGVKVAHLKTLLGFIYTGEVKVSEEELPDLLEVAEMLGVRGLKANKDDEDKGEEEEGEGNVHPREEEEEKESFQEEGVAKTEPEVFKNLDDNPPQPTQIQDPPMLKAEPTAQLDPLKSPMGNGKEEATQNLEEEKEEEEEEGSPVKTEPALSEMVAPKPTYAGLQSQYGYIAPYMSPLVSMSNLAAMYQQQQQHQQQQHQQLQQQQQQIQQQHLAPTPAQQQQTPAGESAVPVKTDPSTYSHPLEHYRQVSDEGKVPLDLLPDDVNAIMAQSTSPVCPICNKDCSNFPNLRSHLQVHNNIRPYACTFCEAKFARVSHLNRHIRTHTGERPFACERCGKSFARQDKLKLHMDRHLGLGSPGAEGKNELLGLLGNMGSNSNEPARKKVKTEKTSTKPDNSQDSPTPTSSSSPYSNMLAGSNTPTMVGSSSSSSLWGGFPLYPQHQTAYQTMYPGMVYPGMSHSGIKSLAGP